MAATVMCVNELLVQVVVRSNLGC